MKKNLKLFALTVLVAIGMFFIFLPIHKNTTEATNFGSCDTLSQKMNTLSKEDTIAALAAAFALEESQMKHSAVSPDGRHVGCLQISRICVAEANRLLGAELFFDGSEGYIDDRLDRQGAYAIFKTIQLHHNPALDVDRAIDVWNRKAPCIYRDNVKRNYYKALIDENLRNYFK